MTINCEIRARIGDLAPQWNALIRPQQDAFCNRADWIDSYVQHFGDEDQPRILCVFHKQQLVGGLALCQSHGAARNLAESALGTHSLRFCGFNAGAEYCDMLAAAGWEVEVADAVVKGLTQVEPKWSQLDLRNVLPDALILQYARDALHPLSSKIETTVSMQRHSSLLPTDFDAYIATLSRRRRKNTRNLLNKAQRQNIEYRPVQAADWPWAYKELQRLHGLRFENQGVFGKPAFRDMHAELIEAGIQNGQACLGLVHYEDKIIAAELSYRHNGTEYAYQGGFDPAYEDISPGKVAILGAIRCAIEAGMQRYDLMCSPAGGYKSSYCEQTEVVRDLQVLPRSLRAQAFAGVREMRRQLLGQQDSQAA